MAGLTTDQIPVVGIIPDLLATVAGHAPAAHSHGTALIDHVTAVPGGPGRPDPAGAVLVRLDTTPYRDRIDSISLAGLIILAAVVTSLVLITAWAFRRQVLEPTRAIIRVLVRRRRGDRTAAAMVSSANELGRIASSINEFLATIDATERDRELAQRQLAEKERNLAETLRAGRMAPWSVAWPDGHLWFETGWSPFEGDEPDPETIVRLDELLAENGALWQADLDRLRNGEAFRTEVRVIGPDGAPRFLELAGRVTARHPDGTARLATGTSRDVTTEHEAEQRIRNAEERWQLRAHGQ